MELNASNPSNTMDRPLITYYSELGTVSKGTLDDEPDGFYVYSLPSQDLLYDSFDSIRGCGRFLGPRLGVSNGVGRINWTFF